MSGKDLLDLSTTLHSQVLLVAETVKRLLLVSMRAEIEDD